ncbi:MAG: aspartate-semialdehyde dehydrogenase [Candidatus Thorarchaeota archaeon]|nr:aspartate-semialdehyde dehydrogenase [Candidatus Thorarchaeota archaeon]
MLLSRLRVCILGATGLVGQQFVRILQEHPLFEVALLTASSHSSGNEYGSIVDWLMASDLSESVRHLQVIETDPDLIADAGVDLVFSALPSEVAGPVEHELASSGLPVFTNAGYHRMRDTVPILIPEINPEHLELIKYQQYGDAGFIVTNSNCSTSGLVFGLRPLQQFGIRSVIVTTYQALSGAGRSGVASMDILGNVIPYIPKEELKIETESRKILGELQDDHIRYADFRINASCARVPVMNGHLESVVVALDDPVTVDRVQQAFASFSGPPQRLDLPTAPQQPVVVLDGPDRPQPVRDLSLTAQDHGMSVKIGRIREKDGLLSFFLLVHNTIRGAAGASVLNAEYTVARGYLPKKEVVS